MGLRAASGSSSPSGPTRALPRVSVVIPAYNAQRYLITAVQSVLNQTFSDFECIIVDDGSSDRTPKIIRDLAARDGRIRLLPIEHGGIVRALNAGVEAARGDLIARMDADDLCLADRFEKQVRYLDAHPECVVVGSKVTLVDPLNSTLWDVNAEAEHEAIEAELLKGNGWAIFHPAAMLRRKTFLQVGGYRPQYEWVEDLDLFLRMGEVGRLANLQEPLLRYRQHFASVNRTRLQTQIERTQAAVAEAYQRRGQALPADFKVRVGGEPLTGYEQIRAWGMRALFTRNFSAARRHALAALRVGPLRYDSWNLLFHALARR